MDMFPNFLHIGVAKAASSWLWKVCKEHPEIYVPNSVDNVNFFTVHYHRGLDWYKETYFSDVRHESAIGEFSNSYLVYLPALKRIADNLSEVRITMNLRNPIESMFLDWAHIHLKAKSYGFDGRKGIGIPLEKCLHHHGHAWFRLYVEPRFYGRHLENVFKLFPSENVMVMLYDDLCKDEEAFLHSFYEFLRVDSRFQSSLIGQDINPDAPDADFNRYLDSEFVAEIQNVFKPDIEHLQKLIDRDLSHWLVIP